jgi:hypothetical protein
MTLEIGDRVAYSRSRIRRRGVGVSVRVSEVLLSLGHGAMRGAAEQPTAAATSIMAPPENMGSVR